MPEKKKKAATRTSAGRAPKAAKVQIVVEVDGTSVGLLDLDWDRLWPAINHRDRDPLTIDWVSKREFESLTRAAVLRRFMRRLEGRLYQGLGAEMVRAELDIENLYLRMEAASHTLGRTSSDIKGLLSETGGTRTDFTNFFWDYLLSDRDVTDLEEEWSFFASERAKKKKQPS
jgi:hypothetical protein